MMTYQPKNSLWWETRQTYFAWPYEVLYSRHSELSLNDVNTDKHKLVHVNMIPLLSNPPSQFCQGWLQWRSQDIAVARAQHGHTTFVRTSV